MGDIQLCPDEKLYHVLLTVIGKEGIELVEDISFGMNHPATVGYFVLIEGHQMSDIITVRGSGERTIVARGNDSVVLHQHSPDCQPIAGGSAGYSGGNVKEVFRPGCSGHRGCQTRLHEASP